jgi:hypothetical protein
MPAQRAILHVSVHAGDGVSDRDLPELTDRLQRDLLALGPVRVTTDRDAPTGGDARPDGELRLTLDRSPVTLDRVVAVVRAWLDQRSPLAVSLRIDDAHLTLGGGGWHTERDRIIATWIDRALTP